jgi:hypothetical protein
MKMEILKKFTTGFFYWWYNQDGSNTLQGYDEYIKTGEAVMLLDQMDQKTPFALSLLKQFILDAEMTPPGLLTDTWKEQVKQAKKEIKLLEG